MYITNKLVRFQKNEITPMVDYIFRAISFLSNQKKIMIFVNMLLHFVVRPNSSMSGHELRIAFKISDEIRHHELRKPQLKNAKGLYFRRYWVQQDSDAIDEWQGMVQCAANDAAVMIWDGDNRIANVMAKIKTCGITPHDYREILHFVSNLGFDESMLPPVHECEIISFPHLESA